MKKKVLFILPVIILSASLFIGGYAHAWYGGPWQRTIDPIVSTAWLDANATEVVILDIRSAGDYAAGHIPGSINEEFVVPFSAWITMRDGLLLEVPDLEGEGGLFETIGSLGITNDSRVVIVTAPNPGEPPFYGLSNATRVAFTLTYAGVKNVAILDGGYPKWVEDGYDTTTEEPTVTPVTYEGTVNNGIIASLNYVRWHLHKADLIDARDADVYFGVTIEPFADKAGHIPGASSLPAPWIWNLNADGTYTFKDIETLGDMASGVLREPWRYWGHRSPKITVYCGVGGYASSWWFVLTQVLGYHNVKFYDGSAQEWVMEDYEMIPYRWE